MSSTIKLCLISLMTIVISSSCICFAEDLAQIKKVVSFKSGPYEDVVIYTNSPVKPNVITLDSPKRLAMVFPNTNICAGTSMPGKTKMITRINAYQYDPITAYVTVQPAEGLNYSYGGFSGSQKFVMEFTYAGPWSLRVIGPDTSEAPAANKAAPEASKVYKETFQCVISWGDVYVVTSEVRKMPPAESIEKKKVKKT